MADNAIYIGVVKSFNPNNGYGFIACEETQAVYGGDVFLHKNELQQAGANVGQQVKFAINVSDKGQPRAVSVQDANDDGPPPAPAPMGNQSGGKGKGKFFGGGFPQHNQMPGAAMGMADASRQGVYTGILKSFNQEKGYGFISCQETEAMFQSDIFLHFSEAIGYRVGDTVGFEVVIGPNGKPQARNLVQKKSVIESAGQMQQWGGGAPQQQQWGGGGDKGWGKGNKGGDWAERSAPYDGGKGKGKGFGKGKGMKGMTDNREFVGMVKSYNADTGYGFVDCTEVSKVYARDAFLTKEQVEAHGLQVGEEIIFQVELGTGGKPVCKVKCRKADAELQNQAKIDQCGMGPHVGMIKSYNEGKGFGFIECEATMGAFGQDVFLHKREMEKVNEVGVNVQFNIQLSDRGQPQAIDCMKID